MRSQLFAPFVAVSLAFGASAYAQAPKPATGSTGSTGAAKPASTGAKPATGAAASTGQTAKPATGAPASTGQAAKPAPAPAAPAQPPAKPTPPPAAPATPPPATAQPPAPAPSNPAPSNPAAGSAAQPSAPQPLPPPSSDAYSYLPDGRRDPFLNLIGGATTTDRSNFPKVVGPAGMTVAEIQVRGVMQSRSGLLAMILGPDSKTYIVHQGDKLADGTIKQITPQGLVILQEVTDPLSLVKQREVRKLLRSLEDAK